MPGRTTVNYRLVAEYEGRRVELTSNIASYEVAEMHLATRIDERFPELSNIKIEEYETFWF